MLYLWETCRCLSYRGSRYGRNRQKINHETFTFYAGCRQHHQEEHQIGTKNFLNKYQIKPVKLNVEERKKLNIGG